MAVINADYAETVAGVQINRFCASGLEATNMAAAQVMAGQSDFAIGGGVESMSRVAMGSDGGAWATDPTIAFKSYFAPQGIGADMIATKWGFSRADVDGFAVESQKRAAAAWKDGRFKKSIVPVKDQIGITLLDHDEHMRPDTTMQSLGSLKASFTQARRGLRLRCGGQPALSRRRAHRACAPRRQLVGHRRRRGRHPDRQQGGGRRRPA